MDQCRDAIPAWIMPLHRVAETIEMKSGAFDIVIVDEASQTGPEGLILQYLGKRCIIVGDDKQISPDEVGIKGDAVRALMGRNFRVIPQYPSAGKWIDLVVEGTKSRLAIECDGDEWHGPDRYEEDMLRQRILERCGWTFHRIRGSAFYGGREREITRVLEAIGAQGIEPVVGVAEKDETRDWIEEVCGQECLEALARVDIR